MDIVVTPAGPGTWTLDDRLARALGTINLSAIGQFSIKPAAGKLTGIVTGPFASLDFAMLEIERRTKGVCQLATSL